MNTTSLPFVSVVIATHDRLAMLTRCLEALAQQTYPPERFEVVVVDDGGTLKQIPSCSSDWPNVRILVVPHGGPAAARNHGWRAARGEIIAFTDDDGIPDPGWLEAGVRAFREGVAVVAGQTVVPVTNRPTRHELNVKQGLESSPFATGNVFYRRQSLEDVHGFDEEFKLPWREDSDLLFRVLERGAGQAVASDAIVVHPVRPTRFGQTLFAQKQLVYDALLYKKHPTLYRTYEGSTPWHFYRITLALGVLLVGLMIRRRRIVWPALLTWLELTRRYTFNRLRDTSHEPRHVIDTLITSLLIPPVAVLMRISGAVKWKVWFL